MADNYLERRMEEYRRSRQGAAVNGVKHRVSGLKAGQVAVDYPSMRVLVAGADSESGQNVVEAFRRFNCRVAVTGHDAALLTRMSQQTGSQYHPDGVTRAVRRLSDAGDPVAVIVMLGGDETVDGVRTIVPPSQVVDAGTYAVVAWCVYAAHPVNEFLALKQ